jgi:hypothetical protein
VTKEGAYDNIICDIGMDDDGHEPEGAPAKFMVFGYRFLLSKL